MFDDKELNEREFNLDQTALTIKAEDMQSQFSGAASISVGIFLLGVTSQAGQYNQSFLYFGGIFYIAAFGWYMYQRRALNKDMKHMICVYISQYKTDESIKQDNDTDEKVEDTQPP